MTLNPSEDVRGVFSLSGFEPIRTPDAEYETRLDRDAELAMREGSLFFEDRGSVQETLRRICGRLNELGIPYAVAGGMALYLHGFRRYTEDVDILVTAEGLARIHEEIEGRGWVRPFATSKNLRDAESKVKIEFLVTGQYPGDGKPKAIAFPDPADVSVNQSGINLLNLPTLISLKLASWLTGDNRAKDLGDVQELIKLLGLTPEFADQLHPYVRQAYLFNFNKPTGLSAEIEMLVREQLRAGGSASLDEIILNLKKAAEQLESLKQSDPGKSSEP